MMIVDLLIIFSLMIQDSCNERAMLTCYILINLKFVTNHTAYTKQLNKIKINQI